MIPSILQKGLKFGDPLQLAALKRLEEEAEECKRCQGTGEIECYACKGTGKNPTEEDTPRAGK